MSDVLALTEMPELEADTLELRQMRTEELVPQSVCKKFLHYVHGPRRPMYVYMYIIYNIYIYMSNIYIYICLTYIYI